MPLPNLGLRKKRHRRQAVDDSRRPSIRLISTSTTRARQSLRVEARGRPPK
jgi:hypothetical protein